MKQQLTESDNLPSSYTALDGLMLLRALRQAHLRYDPSYPAPTNDPLAATRQNKEGIFLADICGYGQVAERLDHDISSITGTDGADSTSWTAMPSLLILPLLSGREWRAVKISLDYSAAQAEITWLDPYGEGYFPTALKQQIFPALEKAILLLYKVQSKQSDLTSRNIILSDTIEPQGLPDIREYDYDSGSFVFGKITRYISKRLTINPPFIGDYNYHNVMEQLRCKHRRMYSDIAGLEGEAIPASILQTSEGFVTNLQDAPHEELHHTEPPIVTTVIPSGFSYREIKRPNNLPANQQEHISTLSASAPQEVDYFHQHVKQHFRSIVDQLEKLDQHVIEGYLNSFQKEVERLADEGMFAETEAVIRYLVLKKAQDDIIHKMATLLAMTLEEDGEAYYSLLHIQAAGYKQNLVGYYAGQNYRFFHQEKDELENESKKIPHQLAKTIDTHLLHEVADPLWQAHIRYTHLSDVWKLFSEYGDYNFSERMKLSDLREHNETLKA